MSEILIEDVDLWAAHNGHLLRVNNAIEGFDVLHNGHKVGVLVQKRGRYQFLDAVTPRETEALVDAYHRGGLEQYSEVMAAEAADKFQSHSFALTTTNDIYANSEAVSSLEHCKPLEAEQTIKANLRLPFASKHYCMSPNINDYVFVPLPGIISDIPNTNGDSLSKMEMLRFIPDRGQQMYETFCGMPAYEEHDNLDITKAKGMIFDVFIRSLSHYQGEHLIISMLVGWDRTKDVEAVNEIISGQSNAYSVGFVYNAYTCSYCGATTTQGKRPACLHTKLGQKTYLMPQSNRLVYRKCHNAEGFEISKVKTPAFIVAVSNKVMVADNLR